MPTLEPVQPPTLLLIAPLTTPKALNRKSFPLAPRQQPLRSFAQVLMWSNSSPFASIPHLPYLLPSYDVSLLPSLDKPTQNLSLMQKSPIYIPLACFYFYPTLPLLRCHFLLQVAVFRAWLRTHTELPSPGARWDERDHAHRSWPPRDPTWTGNPALIRLLRLPHS